jgi:hypothetical protein
VENMLDAELSIIEHSTHEQTKPEFKKWLEKLYQLFTLHEEPKVNVKTSQSLTIVAQQMLLALCNHNSELPAVNIQGLEPLSFAQILEGILDGTQRMGNFPIIIGTKTTDPDNNVNNEM